MQIEIHKEKLLQTAQMWQSFKKGISKILNMGRRVNIIFFDIVLDIAKEPKICWTTPTSKI